MSDFIEINIKENMPPADDALKALQSSLALYKKQKIHCVLIVHGYGSTGKGGVIGRRARKYLMAEQAAGHVKAVVFGEDFDIFNAKARELKNRYKELESLFRVCNHGVTVVEL